MKSVNHREEGLELRKLGLVRLRQLKENRWFRRILIMIKTTSVKKRLITRNTFGTNIGDTKNLKSQLKWCRERLLKLQQLEQEFILLKIKKKANGHQLTTINSTIYAQLQIVKFILQNTNKLMMKKWISFMSSISIQDQEHMKMIQHRTVWLHSQKQLHLIN